jgi:hypothetical protein
LPSPPFSTGIPSEFSDETLIVLDGEGSTSSPLAKPALVQDLDYKIGQTERRATLTHKDSMFYYKWPYPKNLELFCAFPFQRLASQQRKEAVESDRVQQFRTYVVVISIPLRVLLKLDLLLI